MCYLCAKTCRIACFYNVAHTCKYSEAVSKVQPTKCDPIDCHCMDEVDEFIELELENSGKVIVPEIIELPAPVYKAETVEIKAVNKKTKLGVEEAMSILKSVIWFIIAVLLIKGGFNVFVVFGFFIGIVALLKGDIKSLGIKNRKVAGIVTGIFLVGVFISAGSFVQKPVIAKTASVQTQAQIKADADAKAKADADAKAKAIQASKPALEVLSVSTSDQEYGVRYVTGEVRNNTTDKTFNLVTIQINEYDASGAQVGSTLTNTNNLEPNGVWKYKALVTNDQTTQVKIISCTGF